MFKEKIKHYAYRTKTVLEEALIDDRKKPHELSNKELLDKALRGSSKYEKILSFLRLAKNIIPEQIINVCGNKLENRLYFQKTLPFNPEKYKFKERIGKGGGCRVYLLESQTKDQPSLVVKILVPDVDGKTIIESINACGVDYEYMKNVYREIPETILPEQFVIIDDPFQRGVSAAGTSLQPFMAGKIKDIFDFKQEELKEISAKNPVFKEQLAKFCSITQENFQKEHKALDFLGKDNVVIVSSEEGEKLIVLDPYNIYLKDDPKETRHARTNECLKFLQAVEQEIKN